MSRGSRALLTACCALGLVASAAATYVHYQLIRNPGYSSVCDVSATISCSDVYQSRFGTFLGVPVALFGLLAFALFNLLLVPIWRGSEKVKEDVSGFIFAMSTVGLAVVLYLAYVSLFVLKTLCIVCASTYVAMIGVFLASGAASSVPLSRLPGRLVEDLRVLKKSPFALALSLLFLAGAGSALAFFPRERAPDAPQAAAQAPAPTADERSEFERWFVAQPRATLPVAAEGAAVVVVKFNDYQCPPCRQSFIGYQDIFAKYQAERPGAVRLVLRDFPLESECNSNLTNAGPHPAACEAAVAVRLARERNRAEQMEQWLFANQPSLTPPFVRQGAREVAGVSDFEARYSATLELVRADVALGRQLGVRSTPTFFINGVKVEGALPPQYFEQAIAYELQHSAK